MPLTLNKTLSAALLCVALWPLTVDAQGLPTPSPDARQATPVDLGRRVVPLEGQSNFRDLGGYETADGHHVKWGKIFRSGELSRLTQADYARLKPLGIRAIYDLRDQSERTSQPTVWTDGSPHVLHSAKVETVQASMAALSGPNVTVEAARKGIEGFYAQAPTDYAPEYKAIFQELLADQSPLLLHCTAGKDRTGVGSALVLAALGVPRATILQDYALTNQLLKPAKLPANATMKTLSTLPPDAMQAMMRADPAYLETAFNAIDARYGSLDGYLSSQLGVGPTEKARLRLLYVN